MSRSARRFSAAKWRQGSRCRPLRQLALELGVARSTVIEAYEMLLAEGYIVSRQWCANNRCRRTDADNPACNDAEKRTTATPHVHTGRLFDRATRVTVISTRAMGKTLNYHAASELPGGHVWLYSGRGDTNRCVKRSRSGLTRSRGLNVNAADVFITAGAERTR